MPIVEYYDKPTDGLCCFEQTIYPKDRWFVKIKGESDIQYVEVNSWAVHEEKNNHNHPKITISLQEIYSYSEIKIYDGMDLEFFSLISRSDDAQTKEHKKSEQ